MSYLIRSGVVFFLALALGYAISTNVQAANSALPLRHFVAFEFKGSTTPAQIELVIKAFRDLKNTVPNVQSIEAGSNISPEHFNKGLTHAFLVTFANAKDRDAYLVHPEHEKFKKIIGPLVADVFVLDFVGKQ